MKPVRTQDVYDVLAALLEWESQQGGYEARCWKEARRLRNRLGHELEKPHVIPLCDSCQQCEACCTCEQEDR
jgi:hypothetical protein